MGHGMQMDLEAPDAILDYCSTCGSFFLKCVSSNGRAICLNCSLCNKAASFLLKLPKAGDVNAIMQQGSAWLVYLSLKKFPLQVGPFLIQLVPVEINNFLRLYYQIGLENFLLHSKLLLTVQSINKVIFDLRRVSQKVT